MRILSYLAALALFLSATGLMAAWAHFSSAQTPEAAGDRAQSVIKDAKGQTVAVVTMRELAQGGVLLEVRTKGLPPGFHGFHIHTTGKCDPEAVDPATKKKTPFFTAGGHLNPEKKDHPGHAGALPVLLVNGGGDAAMSVMTDRFTVAELFDEDGSSMVIHAAPDNFANVPDRYEASPSPSPKASAAKAGSKKDAAKASKDAKDAKDASKDVAAPDVANPDLDPFSIPDIGDATKDATKDASKDAASDAASDAAKPAATKSASKSAASKDAAKKAGPDAATLMTGDAGARIACGTIEKA